MELVCGQKVCDSFNKQNMIHTFSATLARTETFDFFSFFVISAEVCDALSDCDAISTL